MERGELGLTGTNTFFFVFEGLIANTNNPRLERSCIRMYLWRRALDLWVFDVRVCDWMRKLLYDNNSISVEVITWHPPEFAEMVHDKLWNMDIPVAATKSSEYRFLSHRLAVDPEVACVYDPDPQHRFGYGFKQREFSTSL